MRTAAAVVIVANIVEACVISPDGTQSVERYDSHDEALQKLPAFLGQVADWERLDLGLLDTSRDADALSDFLFGLGIPVLGLNPAFVKAQLCATGDVQVRARSVAELIARMQRRNA